VEAADWDESRWAAILDRVEQRQPGIGLRFWGPPLWLEVTMTGPDSEAWSVAGAGRLPDQPWDWQASAACAEAMALEAAEGDDDDLLEVVSRYTIENLILNAVHEIGEWLRFDAHRLFTAHGRGGDGDGIQGNGVVNVAVHFGAAMVVRPASSPAVSARAGREVAPWRFTYLPGVAVAYGPQGPTVIEDGMPQAGTGLEWSEETCALVNAPSAEFVEAVQRDVHRSLVHYEAGKVCDLFYVDGARPWFLDSGRSAKADAHPLTLTVSYHGESVGTQPDTARSSGRPRIG